MVTSSGNEVFVDQLAHEIEVGLARGREADLDLLEAHRPRGSRTLRRLRTGSIGSMSAWFAVTQVRPHTSAVPS